MFKKILLTIGILLITSSVFAQQVPAPEPVPEPTQVSVPGQVTIAGDLYVDTVGDLEGLILHYGEKSGNYLVNISIPKNLSSYTVGGLEQGKTYFFALTAYDTSGNESGYSGEASHFVPIEIIPDTISPITPTVIYITKGSPVEINIGGN